MRNKTPIALTVTLITIGVFVALLAWQWDAVVERLSEKGVDRERQAWMERVKELEGMIAKLHKGEEAKALPSTERLSQVFGPASPLVRGVSPETMKCNELVDALRAFCKYLDASETVRSQDTYKDSWALMIDTMATLERNLPKISAESYQPAMIIENSFYFFRILRKERIDLFREVLKYEADLAEPLLGILYHWLMTGRKCDKLPSSPSSLKAMYQYAGLFLNTLGGHSYLLRRDSRIRLLTLYYSTRVIHEANLKELNELGIDLRFFLPLIFDEIQSRDDLLYAEEYLQILSDLQLHYFRQE
jgi:hypothetical protein